jgi:hypothetical protein
MAKRAEINTNLFAKTAGKRQPGSKTITHRAKA